MHHLRALVRSYNAFSESQNHPAPPLLATGCVGVHAHTRHCKNSGPEFGPNSGQTPNSGRILADMEGRQATASPRAARVSSGGNRRLGLWLAIAGTVAVIAGLQARSSGA